MPDCTPDLFTFPSFDRRKIEASFTGGHVTSDGGILLLREADRRLGPSAALNAVLPDPRDPLLLTHPQVDLLRQRIHGLALGYEDLNDHDTLRGDLAWQTALERDEALASSPTLCRLEQRACRRTALAFHEVLRARFIASFATPPTELILDFDATDDRVHGRQEGRFFNGFYGDDCFLPLYVFCGEQLLVSYLRPSNIGAAQPSWAILKLLVKALRAAWPQVKILFRGDGGFCRWKTLRWCEKNQVNYRVGLAKNVRLAALAKPLIDQAEAAFVATGQKQRLFGSLDYGAGSWDKKRRVILKAEHTDKGKNPRSPGHQPGGRGAESPRRRPTARAGRWKTASRSGSSGCSLIARAARAGGPISCACRSPARPTCSWKRSAGWRWWARISPARRRAPFVSSS